jgi:hypothetical protein
MGEACKPNKVVYGEFFGNFGKLTYRDKQLRSLSLPKGSSASSLTTQPAQRPGKKML